MKILHLTSINSGGAYRAALRIHEALKDSGVDSNFVSINKLSHQLIKPRKNRNVLVQKFNWRMRNHLNLELEKRRRIINKLEKVQPSLKCEITSLPVSQSMIDFDGLTEKIDIVHLHWMGGYFDYADFFSEIKKPVVWTIHDMNPFFGVFHYRGDAIRNKETAGKFDESVSKIKSRALRKYKYPLAVVSPSAWLKSEAAESRAFKNREITVIPYPLDLNIFNFRVDSTVRDRLGIAPDKTILVAIAESTSNFRKGFDLLIDGIKHLLNVTLLLIGDASQNKTEAEHVVYVGTVKDDTLLSEYLSIADAAVIPSREDNLPNVMLESLACGTPVISFKTGGMTDHVRNYETGLLAEEISAESLAEAICRFVENKRKFNRQFIREYAEKHFNERLIAGEYLEVYDRLISAGGKDRIPAAGEDTSR